MKKLINVLLVSAAVAALVVLARDYKRRFAIEKTNQSAEAAVLEKNAAAKERIDTLKQALSQLAGADGANIDADAAAKLKAAMEEEIKRRAELEAAVAKKMAERLKNDKEFALTRAAAMRAVAEKRHAAFCRVQQLSPEQSEAVAEVEFQWMLRMDDIQMALTLKEPGTDEKALRKAASDEFAANMKAALGDDLYEQFQVYKRQDAAWNYVSVCGASMSLGDMPLSVTQAARLADAIANACPQYQKGKWVDMGTVDWNAVDAAAVDILTPEQMDYFKNASFFIPSGSALKVVSRQNQELVNAVKKLGQ